MKMKRYNRLSPSILAADFNILGEQIAMVKEGGAKFLHFDVMDGIFVPSISFGLPVLKSIRKASNQVYDVHLMIEEPVRYIEEFAQAGADIITFHLEAASDSREVIDKIRSCGKKAGIAIKPKTPVEEIYKYLDKIDMLLIMTVEPGFGGQQYIPESTMRIAMVRQYIDSHKLDCDIEVDGGVHDSVARTVIEVGANIIVAGSAIFVGDAKANCEKYVKVLNSIQKGEVL